MQAGSFFTRAYGSSMLSPSGGFLWAVIICIVHGSSTQVPTNECWLRPSGFTAWAEVPLSSMSIPFSAYSQQSPYTIYAEGVDHPKPQVTEKKAVAFLDTLLYEVFLKLHPRVLSLWCRLGRLNQGDLNLGQLISDQFPLGRLGFKQKGAGKLRIFAILKAFKQAQRRPAHDWCMGAANSH